MYIELVPRDCITTSSLTPETVTNTDLHMKEGIYDRNDCVIRSIKEFMDIRYLEARKIVSEAFNRKAGEGVFFDRNKLKFENKIIPEWNKQYNTDICAVKTTDRTGKNYTLNRFIKKYPKGKFFVLVRGHAFAIKDGVVYGNEEDGKRMKVKIQHAYINNK